MANPWDPAPILPKGEKHEVHLFISVGRALTIWEQLEFSLFQLYQILAGSPRFASEAGYGSIQSSEARLGMVRAAARRMLPLPTYRKLDMVLRSVGKLSPRRNEIAHGQVIRIGDSGNYLTHSFANSRKLRPGKPLSENAFEEFGFAYAYTSDQIDGYAGLFLEQKAIVEAMVREIRELRTPKGKP